MGQYLTRPKHDFEGIYLFAHPVQHVYGLVKNKRTLIAIMQSDSWFRTLELNRSERQKRSLHVAPKTAARATVA